MVRQATSRLLRKGRGRAVARNHTRFPPSWNFGDPPDDGLVEAKIEDGKTMADNRTGMRKPIAILLVDPNKKLGGTVLAFQDGQKVLLRSRKWAERARPPGGRCSTILVVTRGPSGRPSPLRTSLKDCGAGAPRPIIGGDAALFEVHRCDRESAGGMIKLPDQA
jgi:hypothetical protein